MLLMVASVVTLSVQVAMARTITNALTASQLPMFSMTDMVANNATHLVLLVLELPQINVTLVLQNTITLAGQLAAMLDVSIPSHILVVVLTAWLLVLQLFTIIPTVPALQPAQALSTRSKCLEL